MVILASPQIIAEIALVQGGVVQQLKQFPILFCLKSHMKRYRKAKQDKKLYGENVREDMIFPEQRQDQCHRQEGRDQIIQKPGKLPRQGVKPGSPVVVVLNSCPQFIDLGTVKQRIVHGDGFHAHHSLIPLSAPACVNRFQLLEIIPQHGEHKDSQNRAQGNG